MSSMIAELANSISSRIRTIEILSYQMTLFPAPAGRGNNLQFQERIRVRNTDVFRESIGESLDRKISILHKRHLESTMLQFRYAEIHEPGYGSSRDLEVKATAERPAVTCRLKVGFRVPSMWTLGYEITHVLPCSSCSRFLV